MIVQLLLSSVGILTFISTYLFFKNRKLAQKKTGESEEEKRKREEEEHETQQKKEIQNKYFPKKARRIGRIIGSVAVCIPAIILGLIFSIVAQEFDGSVSTSYLAGIVGIATWLAFYIGSGLTIIPQPYFIVIDRLGRCYGTRKAGINILCFPGIIDKIHPRTNRDGKFETYAYRRSQLYDGSATGEEAIDFLDGSSGIVGEAFFRIEEGYELAFAYAVEDPIQRVETLLDDEVRTFFQQLTIQEALVAKNSVWDAVQGKTAHPSITRPPKPKNESTKGKDGKDTLEAEQQRSPEEVEEIKKLQQEHFKDITAELADAGVKLDSRRGIVISDIRLTPVLIKLRELELEGQRQAARQVALGQGYAGVVDEVATALGISKEAAIAFINAQKFLETLPQVGANVIMVGGQGGIQGFVTGVTGN